MFRSAEICAQTIKIIFTKIENNLLRFLDSPKVKVRKAVKGARKNVSIHMDSIFNGFLYDNA